jgi:hypothetical protein
VVERSHSCHVIYAADESTIIRKDVSNHEDMHTNVLSLDYAVIVACRVRTVREEAGGYHIHSSIIVGLMN